MGIRKRILKFYGLLGMPFTKPNKEKYFMAKKGLVNKSLAMPKFSVCQHNRCGLCGRSRGYLRRFGICRICFRELSLEG